MENLEGEGFEVHTVNFIQLIPFFFSLFLCFLFYPFLSECDHYCPSDHAF